MIIKMNNKCENFYNYMGKFFGSRIVQLETNDRIYDDNNKDWFILLNDGNPVAFASVCKNMIKNVYAMKDNDLVELLEEVKKQIEVGASIVPKTYEEVYKKAGFDVMDSQSYKNFVIIRSDKHE